MKPKFTTKEIVSALQDIYCLDEAIFDHLLVKGFVDKDTYYYNSTYRVSKKGETLAARINPTTPIKIITRGINSTDSRYYFPVSNRRDGGFGFREGHKEDGPAFVREYDDGTYTEAWYYENDLHRYGGPAKILRNGNKSYAVHGKYVSDEVHEWLSERYYKWETMNDQEKWELDLFMRSLG